MREQIIEICNYLVKKAKKKLGSHLSARYGCFLPQLCPVGEHSISLSTSDFYGVYSLSI